MAVERARVAQRVLQGDVVHRVQQVLLAAQDVGDAHLRVVDHHAEVVGRHAVGLADDEILHLRGGQHDVLVEHLVAEAELARRHRKPHDGRPALGLVGGDLLVAQRRPLVEVGPLRPLGLAALGGQLLGRLIRLVGQTLLDQPVDQRIVQLRPLALEHHHGVVVVKAEPREVVQHGRHAGVGAAGEVGVLNPQQEGAAEAPGEQPVEECGAGPADVQIAGGRGGEAGDDLGGIHGVEA